MHTIDAIRNEARIVWSVTDDGLKAAIRTAYQTVQAAAILSLVAVGRTAIGAAALTALASVRAYYMNRNDKGARYD